MLKLPDLQKRLDTAFSFQRATLLREAINAAGRLGVSLYLVGGAVRDLLIGVSITDLDLVVEGDAQSMASALATTLKGEVLSHSQFGTVKIHVLGQHIDIVTARRETYRRPGALPTVRPGTITEDLERRDFTINAIALPLTPGPLHLLDPRDGQGDIARGLVRVLHSASFQDDATRILRAVRYEKRLGFSLEKDTEKLLRRNLSMMDTISGDRLRRELHLIFREDSAAQVLARTAELGALSAIYPHLPDVTAIEQRLSLQSLPESPVNPLHYVALLASSMEHDQRQGFIQRLNMPVTWTRVVQDVALAGEAARSLTTEIAPITTYRLLRPLSLEAVQTVAVLSADETARENFRKYIQEWRTVRPLLNGRDLMRLGVLPGPQVGVMLEALRDARLKGRIRTRREEKAFVRDWPYPTP